MSTKAGVLIAGRHWLEAVRQLGWETIPVTIIEDRSANRMRIMEIDENLMRAELSPAERKRPYESMGRNHLRSQSGQIGHSESYEAFR